MALAELISKLRNKRQVTERSAFQHYLQAVKLLAAGEESDADEIAHVLDVASKNEDDLARDVNLQQQRLAWAAQLQQHRQAISDKVQAERDFLTAQQKLQRAIDELSPAVQAAEGRLKTLDQIALTTYQAESRLSELVLDMELLERERAISVKIGEVCRELDPLTKDRAHKQASLENAEFGLARLQAREEKTFLGSLTEWFNTSKDARELKERGDDLKSQLSQLDAAIRPRQVEQQRLRRELDAIHQEKLKP